jgi:hypothetical protein
MFIQTLSPFMAYHEFTRRTYVQFPSQSESVLWKAVTFSFTWAKWSIFLNLVNTPVGTPHFTTHYDRGSIPEKHTDSTLTPPRSGYPRRLPIPLYNRYNGIFPRGAATQNHWSPADAAEIKNACSFTSTSQYVLMEKTNLSWCPRSDLS